MGCKNLLSYRGYPFNGDRQSFSLNLVSVLMESISILYGEDKRYVKYSWYDDKISGLKPKVRRQLNWSSPKAI